jgi:hypothetical protein
LIASRGREVFKSIEPITIRLGGSHRGKPGLDCSRPEVLTESQDDVRISGHCAAGPTCY